MAVMLTQGMPAEMLINVYIRVFVVVRALVVKKKIIVFDLPKWNTNRNFNINIHYPLS